MSTSASTNMNRSGSRTSHGTSPASYSDGGNNSQTGSEGGGGSEAGSSDSEEGTGGGSGNGVVHLLAVVLDLNPIGWELTKEEEGKVVGREFQSSLEQLLVFFNTFLADSYKNYLTLIAAHPNYCDFIYPQENSNHHNTNTTQSTNPTTETTLYHTFQHAHNQIKSGLDHFLRATETRGLPDENSEYSAIASALSRASCYINKIVKKEEFDKVLPRVLIISVSPDAPIHYIPMMNAIFSAQRMGFPIDTIKLSGGDSMFLQQASHITGGRFLDLRTTTEKEPTTTSTEGIDNGAKELPGSLLQYLVMGFLPDPITRKILISPGEPGVDFRAACFCHKKVVDIGYVCSVCLSIFCQFYETCSTCKSKLSMEKV